MAVLAGGPALQVPACCPQVRAMKACARSPQVLAMDACALIPSMQACLDAAPYLVYVWKCPFSTRSTPWAASTSSHASLICLPITKSAGGAGARPRSWVQGSSPVTVCMAAGCFGTAGRPGGPGSPAHQRRFSFHTQTSGGGTPPPQRVWPCGSQSARGRQHGGWHAMLTIMR